jgi:predicted MFS family arabinose efflux permease
VGLFVGGCGGSKVNLQRPGRTFALLQGFAIGGSTVVVAGLFVLYGLFQGTYRAIGKALASDLSPGRLSGTGLGFYSSTVGLTSLVASVAGGQLWDRLGPSATFWYGAVLGMVGIAAVVVLVAGSKPKTMKAL